MMGRSINVLLRGDILALVLCLAMSLTLLFLPTDTRVVVADRLGIVLTSPYIKARNYGKGVFELRDQNTLLTQRIFELELQNAAAERSQRDAERLAGPALEAGLAGDLIPCRVIVRQRSRFATMIKVRSLEPVDWRPWQPVVSRAGYLGRLRTVVSDREAWVELLSAPDFALGVEFERTGVPGVLRPRGDRLMVEMVGRDADVLKDDKLITSGIAEVREVTAGMSVASTPRGFPVGTVTAVESPADQIFKEILVEPSARFEVNETVFVVADLPTAEGGRP